MCLPESVTNSKIWKIMMTIKNVIAGFWMFGDMITDGLSVHTYWNGYQDGKVPIYFWILGGLCMILPTLVSTISLCCVKLHKEEPLDFLLMGPLYFLYVPAISILSALTVNITGNYSQEESTALKLFEVLFEALPQACLAIAYLIVTDFSEGYVFPLISITFSLIMCGIGLYSSCKVCSEIGRDEDDD